MIRYLETRVNKLIDNHNKLSEQNNKAVKEFREQQYKIIYGYNFELFFESRLRKNSEAEEVTFTKIYREYCKWYADLADAPYSKLKEVCFKQQLEAKLNIIITKYVPGIQLFSSKEEAHDFDKNNS
jgi:hypothetical protein